MMGLIIALFLILTIIVIVNSTVQSYPRKETIVVENVSGLIATTESFVYYEKIRIERIGGSFKNIILSLLTAARRKKRELLERFILFIERMKSFVDHYTNNKKYVSPERPRNIPILNNLVCLKVTRMLL